MTEARPPEPHAPEPDHAQPPPQAPSSDLSPEPGPALSGPESTRAKLRTALDALGHPFSFGFALTLGALAALVLGLALSSLTTVLMYIVLALFVTLGLDPAVRALERRGLGRPWAIVITFLVFALAIVGVLWLIIPTVVRQIVLFVQSIPGFVDDAVRSETYARLQEMFGDGLGTLTDRVEEFLTDPSSLAMIGGGALQAGFGIASGFSGLIIVLVLALYFLASLQQMKHSFYRLAPARHRAGLEDLTEQITQSIGGYLAGMVILALCNAAVVFILHLVLGLAFPALMAVTAFCITLIPLVGTVLFWIIGSALALFTDPVTALVFAVVYLVYMQVEAYLLTPRVMTRVVSVPGSLVVIGALVGGTLLGLLGALIAIPVTASVLLIIKNLVIPRQDAKT
jgi:predicted PurR-regulated permease PerM